MTDESSASSVPLPPPHPTAEPTIYVGRFEIPPGYAKAAAGAFQRFSLSQPATIVYFVVLGLIICVDILVLTTAHIATSPTSYVFLLIVALLVIARVASYRSLARRLERNATPGAFYDVTLTENTITVHGPAASSTVRYDYYEQLDERGDFLFLKMRGARLRSIVPRGLFTDEWVNYLHGRIDGARPTA